MRTVYPGVRGASVLHSSVRSYLKSDFASAGAELDAFFTRNAPMRRFRVDEILPKGGTTIRLMARLQSDDGARHFLKISRPTSEFAFFQHGEGVADALGAQGIEIVYPSHAIRAPGLLGLVTPYHEFMLDGRGSLDLPSASAAVAKLNCSGTHLKSVMGRSTQQIRAGFLPNLIRRTVLNVPFLTNERDVLTRTVRALSRYRDAQGTVTPVFCHGDVSTGNIYQHRGATLFIDFANYFFTAPGFDLARLYSGSEERLAIACQAYADAFDGPISLRKVQLAAIYGHFLLHLREAARGRNSAGFRVTLGRLEAELEGA